MPNLSDFLKCKKVRCVHVGFNVGLLLGKEYEVVEVTSDRIRILNDNGLNWLYQFNRFEPVIETAIQATNALDDTPMGTRTVNEFKVGNRVYYGIDPEIYPVTEIDDEGWLRLSDWAGFIESKLCCHATPENYERLSATFENIEFEVPKQELTGSDLCRAMLEEWRIIPCLVSDVSDEQAIQEKHTLEFIDLHSSGTFKGQRHEWTYAVPFDPKTGNVLTSEVLDD